MSVLRVILVVGAIGVAVALLFSGTPLAPIAGLLLLAAVAIGFGPMRSRGGVSAGSDLYAGAWDENDFKKPPNEGDLL